MASASLLDAIMRLALNVYMKFGTKSSMYILFFLLCRLITNVPV